MSNSVRSLKRKDRLRNKDRKPENKIVKSNSLPNLQEIVNKLPITQAFKSETNVSKRGLNIRTMNSAKSERFLDSIIQVDQNALQQENLDLPHRSTTDIDNFQRIKIFGYELMESRDRFTIFKLRIENPDINRSWLVLRRYTDFVRLLNKLKSLFPYENLKLPKKNHFFFNNFSSNFIDNRIQGLQTFIETIMDSPVIQHSAVVRDFFCLDEPPTYSESMDECKAIFENQEETIQNLRKQLKNKDELINSLEKKLLGQIKKSEDLELMIKNNFEQCSKCLKNMDLSC